MLLSVGAGSLPLAASDSPEMLRASYFSVFPGKYSKDGKPFLFTYQRNDDVIDRFYVYDEDMQLIKEIEPLKVPPCVSKYFSQRRSDAYEYLEPSGSESTYGILDINGETTGLSIERVQSYIFALNGRGEIATLPDGTNVIALNFYDEGIYGKKYPSYYYREINGEWHECQQWYNGVNWGPFGEWREVEEGEDRIRVEADSFYLIPESGGDSEYYRLSSGIFGDDYHYLMPMYKSENYSYENEYYDKPGWIYEKSWGTRYVQIGYTVYDSSNNEVMSFKYPAGYTRGYEPYFFQMGEKRYIGIDEVEDAEGNEYLLIYHIGNDNSVSFVTAAPSSKVSPRNPKRGEKVSVTLDTPVGNGDAMVQVVSTSGRTMLSKKIPSGQTLLDIDTSGFSQGMYVVTVSGNGVSKEAAKIIVR